MSSLSGGPAYTRDQTVLYILSVKKSLLKIPDMGIFHLARENFDFFFEKKKFKEKNSKFWKKKLSRQMVSRA